MYFELHGFFVDVDSAQHNMVGGTAASCWGTQKQKQQMTTKAKHTNNNKTTNNSLNNRDKRDKLESEL
jgi:hypothetical protein